MESKSGKDIKPSKLSKNTDAQLKKSVLVSGTNNAIKPAIKNVKSSKAKNVSQDTTENHISRDNLLPLLNKFCHSGSIEVCLRLLENFATSLLIYNI
jgi:hypothetical protein